jgi:hypothetical protein
MLRIYLSVEVKHTIANFSNFAKQPTKAATNAQKKDQAKVDQTLGCSA